MLLLCNASCSRVATCITCAVFRGSPWGQSLGFRAPLDLGTLRKTQKRRLLRQNCEAMRSNGLSQSESIWVNLSQSEYSTVGSHTHWPWAPDGHAKKSFHSACPTHSRRFDRFVLFLALFHAHWSHWVPSHAKSTSLGHSVAQTFLLSKSVSVQPSCCSVWQQQPNSQMKTCPPRLTLTVDEIRKFNVLRILGTTLPRHRGRRRHSQRCTLSKLDSIGLDFEQDKRGYKRGYERISSTIGPREPLIAIDFASFSARN